MKQIRVLIVEDERIIARDLQSLLNSLGYEVIGIVGSGHAAIKVAAEEQPDLILMDIVLKCGMDGVEAAERIRHKVNCPVIFVTGRSNGETVSRTQSISSSGYLVKPFNKKDLVAAIDTALSQSRHQGD